MFHGTEKSSKSLFTEICRAPDNNFDFNFLLTFDVINGFQWEDIFDQFKAKKYDVLNVDIYGYTRRGNAIKGRRITGKGD